MVEFEHIVWYDYLKGGWVMSMQNDADQRSCLNQDDSESTEANLCDHRLIFSKNLQHHIKKSGISQKEIAHVIGVSTGTFSEWMNGKKYPRIERIEALAEILNISITDLIADSSDSKVAKKQQTQTDNISIVIGNRIRERRKALNMSADELAELIGKDRATVYRYESGKIENMPLGLLSPLADALNVHIDYFISTDANSNIKEQEPSPIDVLDVVLRLHSDEQFLGVVKKLCSLDNQKLNAIKDFLEAFSK